MLNQSHQANALKDRGNKAFAAKDYDSAIGFFTQAIALDPQNHVLYSNRSAAHAGKKAWNAALEDAEKVRRKPSSEVTTLIACASPVHKCQPKVGQRVRPERRSSSWRATV